ncbi:MAG TPA: ribosome biogenesis GTPase Der [Acidobacteriaceae bacterium]|nr:ribosome biogenesis GTPase Der [Acidobacteriaceae bacterium]
MPPRPSKKRLGKKHRQATTRPKKGAAPRRKPTTGARLTEVSNASPKGRKKIASDRRKQEAKRRIPTQSPERERRQTIDPTRVPQVSILRPGNKKSRAVGDEWDNESHDPAEAAAWSHAESLASQMSLGSRAARTPNTSNLEPRPSNLPLIAIVGRPNVGKSTLFNRLTGSRRSIVGDEPGITRDRIYADLEWLGRNARLVDTGGVLPSDPDLIPAEIFRQAQTALSEADAIIMVVDGRTELAAPDLELARLLLRSGKPVFLAVNKIDTAALAPHAGDFRRLGFKNIIPISAEHAVGIGDLLDDVFAALPEPSTEPSDKDDTVILSEARSSNRAQSKDLDAAHASTSAEEPSATDPDDLEPRTPLEPRTSNLEPTHHPRHAEHIPEETRIAIIGRPNVGKSTLLNALTGSARAIVSPIAGTTRDAVDELVTRNGQQLRFIDTAGIRRKGKTRLMAEKLSVVMARRHLESADIALLVLDASAGVTALDATIGGYAHESGRSVILVVNKWDLLTSPAPTTTDAVILSEARSKDRAQSKDPRISPLSGAQSPGAPFMRDRQDAHEWESKKSAQPKASQKIFEQQLRDRLKFLDYAPVVFLSAAAGTGLDGLYRAIAKVARERRKRVTTGEMNRFLARTDFQAAPVPLARRVKIYYITQAAVAPPTFVLFTDKAVPLHFAFERFLANRIREAFGFDGTPLRFLTRARNKKS